MRPIADWFRPVPRRQPRARTATCYQPRLEALEDRHLLSVSAATSVSEPNGVFIRYNDGELFLHDASGFQRIDINVASVSAGTGLLPLGGGSPVNAAYILYNNGEVFQWVQGLGFQFIDINAVSVASGVGADDAFILYNNGQLFHHLGASSSTGFSFIADNVTSMAIVPPAGFEGSLGDVFYVQTNHMLSEHLLAGGSMVIDGNVQSVGTSGFAAEPDTTYILYTNSALYFFSRTAIQRFRPIDTNVTSVSGSTSTIPGTSTIIDAAYYVREGVLIEWVAPNPASESPDGTYNYVDQNVVSVSAGQTDSVFIVYDNDMLFEHTGLSRGSGFTFIDSNVSP
jgi:hypothetical protein